jgi:SAM-dependent methyltransferase
LKTVVALSVLALCAAAAVAQTPSSNYEPSFGQEGKDVVWVPTASPLVERMLDMAKVTPKDFVMDLGSGDGRTVIAAAQRGARALGIEYNADMVALSRTRAKAAGVEARAEIRIANLSATTFRLSAVPLGPQADDKQCATLTINQANERDTTGTVAWESCWKR